MFRFIGFSLISSIIFIATCLWVAGGINIAKGLSSTHKPVKVDITSVLLNTTWSQLGEYTKYSPNGSRLGCWSAAFAQIFYYHKLKPVGQVSFTSNNGYPIDENLEAYNFNWDLFSNHFNASTTEQSRNETAKFIYFTAIVIQKKWGTDGYSLGIFQTLEHLEKYYKCKLKLYDFFSSNFVKNREAIKKVVKNEIDNKYPLMFYFDNWGSAHAVVLDGYREKDNRFYVHLNMGWGGVSDGWYDLFREILYRGDLKKRLFVTVRAAKEPDK